MRVRKNPIAFLALGVLAISLPVAGPAKPKHDRLVTRVNGPAVLWSDPVDLESRDLFYGPGGRQHEPHGPFTFIKEDLSGTNPKFDVKDRDGVKWKVKLGIEARPETVATRIVWAVGYHANEDYFLPELKVGGMPARLHRGWKLISPDGSMRNVRLKREDEKKAGTWAWGQDPFTGTRELYGLRTLMAVINNWDLKDENNAIYEQGGERVYMVSDLGASFGCAGRCWPRDRTKGDFEKYSRSAFIRASTAEMVSFETPTRENFRYLVNPKEYWMRLHLRWIGRDIPRTDAKWMGDLLGRLSARQVEDAFRAAGYSQQEADAFSGVLEHRITELKNL